MEQDLVSIVTPTYNSAEYVKSAIKSVLNQTYQNWELLITDDHSEDGTLKVVEEYCKRDQRIKIFCLKENQGAGVARNLSIRNAAGRFIAFLDSDDVWNNRKLELQVEFMIRHGLPLSYTSYDVLGEDGKRKRSIKAKQEVTYYDMLKNNYIGCLTAMYDSSITGKVYMPLIRKRQDWALWLDITKNHGMAKGMSDSLACYMDVGQSLSSNKISLIKYNYRIYRHHQKFSVFMSGLLTIRFIWFYVIK